MEGNVKKHSDLFEALGISAPGIVIGGNELTKACYRLADHSGWWKNTDGTTVLDNPLAVPTKLMLVVSELAEAMEGDRKGKNDDKLPHRSMLEVELADAVIRIFDLAGALDFDLGSTILEKLWFNLDREDHKMESRQQGGGKKY